MKADKKGIRARLRELKAHPDRPGAAAEAQRLAAAYRRLQSAGRSSGPEAHEEPAQGRSRAPVPVPDGLTEADQAAVETWPPELRARLNESAFNQVVDRASSVSDPDNWGAKNDLRRRGARP
ncbi:hypothetical protein AB0I69_24470 [Streptomyces sp. NPDC050508]|uniref:hypothetical protein n=1 Tax=Streptomyces sp. NPDC050508 TaxID=3155405 RepID=UPI0034440482